MVKQSPHLTQTSSVLLSCPFAATGSKHRPPQRACLLKVPLGRDSFSDFSWFSMPVTVLRRAGWSRVLRGAFLLECVGCFAEAMGLEEDTEVRCHFHHLTPRAPAGSQVYACGCRLGQLAVARPASPWRRSALLFPGRRPGGSHRAAHTLPCSSSRVR